MREKTLRFTEESAAFWDALDALAAACERVIDRPRGTVHPKYPSFVYPLDYGYLKNTSSADGEGIDIWLGSDARQQIDAVIVTVDLLKRDSEIKILIGCTEDEKLLALRAHNETEFMKGLLIRR